MGVYSTLIDAKHQKVGQVKLWSADALVDYNVGDTVPTVRGNWTYSIAMREGGYINIIDRVFVSWTEEPAYEPVFDKYGDYFTETTKGPMDGINGFVDKYFF